METNKATAEEDESHLGECDYNNDISTPKVTKKDAES